MVRDIGHSDIRVTLDTKQYGEVKSWLRKVSRASVVNIKKVTKRFMEILQEECKRNIESEGYGPRPLDPTYADWKAAHGGGGKPILVLTGESLHKLTETAPKQRKNYYELVMPDPYFYALYPAKHLAPARDFLTPALWTAERRMVGEFNKCLHAIIHGRM